MMALPLSFAVAAVVGDYPSGDGVLLDPGGMMLLETARLVGPPSRSLFWIMAMVGTAGAFLLLWPLGVLVASVAPRQVAGRGNRSPRRAMRQLLGQAGEHMGTLVLLMGITLAGQALMVVIAMVVGRLLGRSLNLSDPWGQVLTLGFLGMGLVAAWALGLVQDIARVAAIQHERRLIGAIEVALATARSGLLAMLAAAGWRTGLGAVMLAAVGWMGLRVEGAPPSRALLSATLHLVALFGAVLLRASWLRWVTDRVVLAYGFVPGIDPASPGWPAPAPQESLPAQDPSPQDSPPTQGA